MSEDRPQVLTRKTWKEFKSNKMLWFVNRLLHLFGWAIVVVEEDNGTVIDAYPARTRFRGFDSSFEAEGFRGLTKYIAENIDELSEEAGVNNG